METQEQREWLAAEFENWTTQIEFTSPSHWAESVRYLPPSVTNLPGYYSFSVAPYLREPLDCLSLDSPIREVAIMKGVQVGFTVGVLENFLGYAIAHVRSAPCMMVTADAELANLRLSSNIVPMLNASGLSDVIKSLDEYNPRKTGRTDRKIEWIGGGFLIPFGAQNANKLRSLSIRFLMRDEIDGWPVIVGKDGDPIRLTHDRTAAYEDSRKILDGSTPLILGESKIHERFNRGDQRYYFVCCLGCGEPQILRFSIEDDRSGARAGLIWELEGPDNRLVPGSVRYRCPHCGHEHSNDDKTRLLDPANGAEWRPTATPVSPFVRSYHMSALYSPPGMATWEECVRKWLDAYDPKEKRVRNLSAYQTFQNNVLGWPFELVGERLQFTQVSPHRRRAYRYGEIPNEFAIAYCGSPVLLLVCTVDVHKDFLAVAITGFATGGRIFLIDYWRFEGDTEFLDDSRTWGNLQTTIENSIYTSPDGKHYPISLTLIDSGYRTDQVYRFAGQYESGVIAVKGREWSGKGVALKHFQPIPAPMGTLAFGVMVDMYKDRLAASLAHEWSGHGIQPEGHFNAPIDCLDSQLNELTVESKRERIHPQTKQRIGFYWHRPSGARNELWDLLVYAVAGVDILAASIFPPDEKRGAYLVDWAAFWQHAEGGAFYELR